MTAVLADGRIATMCKHAVQARWQVGNIIVITITWIAPLVWFNLQLVRHGRPLLTIAYITSALLSISVI